MGNPQKRKKALRLATALQKQEQVIPVVEAAVTEVVKKVEEVEKVLEAVPVVEEAVVEVKPSKKKKVASTED